MAGKFTIETMQRQDWAQVRTIFGEGLATGLAAFRLTPPIWQVWDKGHLPFGRLVARAAAGDPLAILADPSGRRGRVLGWGALSPVADS